MSGQRYQKEADKSSRPARLQLPRKPQYITLDASIDFFTLFQKVAQAYELCFMLESLGQDSHIARHSVIGFDPAKQLYANGNILTIENRDGTKTEYESDNPYYLLRDIVPQDVLARGYVGGLTGYLGYDAMRYFEPSLKIKTSEHFDAFRFGLYEDGLIYDKMTGSIEYFYYRENRIAEVRALLAKKCLHSPPPKVKDMGSSMSQAQHAQAVDKVKQHILAGQIFQCEVGFKSWFEVTGDDIQIYAKLREINPSPQMYYMRFKQQRLLGASPELLFRMRQKEMETYPLAGTTGRGNTLEEDQLLAKTLLNNPKEIAEHNMIVDLHRNDIGKVARFGSVKVRNLMDIKRFSHVQHISSEIVGLLAENEDMFSALASNFPAGTLTGAPKIEAMKIIDALETDGRGPYGGAVGNFSFNGDCTFAIPIRTLFLHGSTGYVQTCGGNVYDSNAADEYIEIERKFAGTKKVLDGFMEK